MFSREVPTGVRLFRRAGLIAAAAVASVPLVAVAAPRHDATVARSGVTIALGSVYGGVTDDGFGLVVEVSPSGRKVVRMATGLEIKCTSGASFSASDGWSGMRIAKRKFSASFGPQPQRNDDGTTTDFEGTVSGTFNRSRTKVSGTWTLKGTDRDAAGAVTDTCDSGVLNWTAKQ
jgi:hypothetical protein